MANLINNRALGTKSQSEGRKGKMEGKTRKARKLALLIASCMAALLFNIGQPRQASAQVGNVQVAAHGVGDLLIFQYWTTQLGRDTLFAIVNAFGGQAQRFVHVRLREGVASLDVRNFTICLSQGDVWTAALTASGTTASILRVGNAGSCDAAVGPGGFTPPPAAGVAVPIAAPFGYIEAFTMEAGGGDDTLWGVATPLNVTGGLSSSYDATALLNFNAIDESANVISGAANARGTAVSQALAREGGVDKELLFTRYVAGAGIGAVTQLILTFPTGVRPPATDPVSAFFFDENENINFSPRNVTISQEVNVCTISLPTGATFARIVCNAEPNGFDIVGSAGTFVSGWVRLINNVNLGPEIDLLDAAPASRFSVIGMALSSFTGGGGLQFDQLFPIQWAATNVGAAGALNCPVGSSFNCASSFAPWFAGTTLLAITPGDNITGAANRTGTTVK